MHTMGPWKVGKQVGDKWAVVTTNPVNGRPPRGDDMEKYGGTPVCMATLENARLIAVAPCMHAAMNRSASTTDNGSEADLLLQRVATGMPV